LDYIDSNKSAKVNGKYLFKQIGEFTPEEFYENFLSSSPSPIHQLIIDVIPKVFGIEIYCVSIDFDISLKVFFQILIIKARKYLVTW